MATINAQPSSSNAAVMYSPASVGGDVVSIGSSQRATIIVRNGSGASITVTLAAVQPCSQGFTHNVATTCAAGADTEIAIPPACITASGTCGITYTAVTTVSVAALTT